MASALLLLPAAAANSAEVGTISGHRRVPLVEPDRGLQWHRGHRAAIGGGVANREAHGGASPTGFRSAMSRSTWASRLWRSSISARPARPISQASSG